MNVTTNRENSSEGPSATARIVVRLVAALGPSVAIAVALVVVLLALLLGAPVWLVTPALLAALGRLFLALERVRRSS
ncbi:hypothetical protein [Nocardioides sp.]|uniref:hypothetical protein n=1 Tax=Nocardioides sp. TaxID=35761 RepID=UPI002B27478F|nr:hypothetical protein [Nocardioides sp.]